MDRRELAGGSLLNETWTKACLKRNQHTIEAGGPMLGRRALGAQSKLTIMLIEGHCSDVPIEGHFSNVPIEGHFSYVPIEGHYSNANRKALLSCQSKDPLLSLKIFIFL